MIATFLRSSSVNDFDFCENKYFIAHNIGLESVGNLAAERGSILHKVMELLACNKLGLQTKKESYTDDLLGEVRVVAAPDAFSLLTDVYNTYTENSPFDWTHKDFLECQKLLRAALTFNDGMFDPSNHHIISPELRFDVPIDKPWAYYKFEKNPGEYLEGQLVLKGTVDLIIRESEDPLVLHVVDYKSGKHRTDWKTDQEKDEAYLENDTQILLYFYALSHLFPLAETIIFTIYYIQAGGPYTVFFQKADLDRAETFLCKKFNDICGVTKPKLNLSWKCRFCHFSKGNYKDGQTACEYYRKQIVKKGFNEVMREEADWDRISSYRCGGGKSYAE